MVDTGSGQGRASGAQTTLVRKRIAAGLMRVGALWGVAGCGEPAADVVVAWVDGIADDDGNRGLRIYEAGERDVASIVPDIPGSGIDLLQIGVDGRARGVAVSATDATVWFELGSGRRVTLSAEAARRKELVAPGFSFTSSGDAIMRALEVDPALPPVWLLALLSGPATGRVHALTPPTVAAQSHHWSLVHAADAPVLAWIEAGNVPSSLNGRVLALAYPSEEGQGPLVDELRPLARGVVYGRGPVVDDSQFLAGCPEGVCMSPSGRVLWTLAADGECDLQRWSWVEAGSAQADTLPVRVSLPCPGGAPVQLVAALDDDLLVLDDSLRIYLVEPDALVDAGVDAGADDGPAVAPGLVAALPKPGGQLVPYVVAHGRVLVVSSQQGEVARVDADGVRMVSGVQSTCALRDGFAVSPGGTWVVQSCNGQNGESSGLDGQIQRISVLGLELYAGVPMRPIAVDDEGNVLLYSIASNDDDGAPRGLFVLSGDGKLTRVDELEPQPGLVMVTAGSGESVPGRFAAG
jgi:hypothetical protein